MTPDPQLELHRTIYLAVVIGLRAVLLTAVLLM